MRCEARLRSHRPISHRPVKPLRGQPVELLVGDLVEAPDGPAVGPTQLVEPDVGALGQQHHARHPVEVLAEALDLGVGLAEAVQRGRVAGRVAVRGAAVRGVEAHPDGTLIFGQHVERDDQPVAEALRDEAPALADPAQLLGQRAGRLERRPAQQRDQVVVCSAQSRAGS